MNRFHAGRAQAPLGRPAPEYYSLTRDLPRLRYFIFPARALPRRRDVVAHFECGRVEGRHPGTLLASAVLGRGTRGCRRALPRAQLGAPRPQAREPDVGRVRPSVGNVTPPTRVVSSRRGRSDRVTSLASRTQARPRQAHRLRDVEGPRGFDVERSRAVWQSTSEQVTLSRHRGHVFGPNSDTTSL